ncbi:hypothetical protein NE857_33675 (plasmid) [Nocardiopsis exhalans]|uniref:PPM-type phosphatase domain-containing protein n=1 Tax=Nocardiopsis exhalans TaxID=163604 RepID=A0ABY5DGW3_9ACTN|nr:hypothetical protein [Nocardiopsis exhalans]USY23582.1 hypothetical protein NE857_33675 [Nocardiopsis exhalans]
MPSNNRARTRAIRQRMAATGENYATAARQVDAHHRPPAPAPGVLADPVRAGIATDQGPRPNQSDAAAVEYAPDGTWAAALIDGYGSHPGVPAAARRAAHTAARLGARTGSAAGGLRAAGNELTATDEAGWPEPDCVGTVLLARADGHLDIAWTGDVRLYVLGWSPPYGLGTFEQATVDATEGQRMRQARADGQPVHGDPAEHDHEVLTTLGRLNVFPYDLGERTEIPLFAAMVLTTDGVHDALDHQSMDRLVAEHPDPQECAHALVQAARAADAAAEHAVDDNASAVVLRVQNGPRAQRARRAHVKRQAEQARRPWEGMEHDLDVPKANARRADHARRILHEHGYGTLARGGDAAAVAAVEHARGQDPEAVNEDVAEAARILAQALEQRNRR